MSSRTLRARPLRLALLLGAGLLAVVGLALAGGCGGQPSSSESTGRPSQAVASSRPGSVAHATAAVFAQSTPPRVADTWGEIRAREFVYGAFQQYGYYPRMEEFIADDGRRVHSADIVAVKDGQSAEQLIIGANYDARGGDGYVDNAVGVGLLLELAARVKDRETPYTLVFVAFGAEVPDLLGSRHYADSMSAAERRATVGMINLDAVAGGDFLYVFSRPGGPEWLRDDMLAAAQDLGIPLKEVPAHRGAAAGTVEAAGSDTALAEAGIVTAGLASGNWEVAPAAGDVETAEYGRVSGTRRDTVEFVEEKYPGRVQGQLSDLARLLDVLLTSRLEKRP